MTSNGRDRRKVGRQRRSIVGRIPHTVLIKQALASHTDGPTVTAGYAGFSRVRAACIVGSRAAAGGNVHLVALVKEGSV